MANMTPYIWGSSVWNSIHFIAAGYPKKPTSQQKKNYCQYFKALSNVLPCASCSISFKKYMKILPLRNYLNSRKRLLYWTYLVHNKVNKKLKKKVRISWGNVYKKYITLSYSTNKLIK